MAKNSNQFRVSVLINSYNYGEYVGEAIASVLSQDRSVDELIIVDDGSTDNSAEIIQDAIRNAPHARLIQQANAGQLSAMQTGIMEATGEILFFLDADDYWMPEHVSTYLKIFHTEPEVDSVYSAHTRFGDRTDNLLLRKENINHGLTVLQTLYLNVMIGAPTSSMAIKRELLDRFIPVDQKILDAWKICGDDVINRGCSIFRGVKYHLTSLTVRYRVHGNNNFHSSQPRRKIWKYIEVVRGRSINEYFRQQASLPDDFKLDYVNEFRTNPSPTPECYEYAVETAKALDLPYFTYLNMRLRLRRFYRAARKKP